MDRVHMEVNLIAERRYDKGIIYKTETSPEGYLVSHAIVTRTGVFDYKNPDGTIRKELRHPDDVFKPDSLDTIKLKPVTNDHPQQKLVNSDNYHGLAVGFTGETIKKDGKHVSATFVITDPKTIKDIKDNNKRELSLGYTTDLIPESGNFDGEDYSHRQTNVKYNHLALVDKARAGPQARIHLDGQELDSIKNDYETLFKEIIPMSDAKLTMVNIDGISYQCPPEVANQFSRFEKKIASLSDKNAKITTDLEKAVAEKDHLSQRLDEAGKVNLDDKIHEGVKKRIQLIQDVMQIMGKNELKLDSLTEREIKTLVVKEKCPSVNIDSLSDVYIDARFDLLKEKAIEESKGESEAFKGQRAQVLTKLDGKKKDAKKDKGKDKGEDDDDDDDDDDMVNDARERMCSRMYSRHVDKRQDIMNGYGKGNTSNQLAKDGGWGFEENSYGNNGYTGGYNKSNGGGAGPGGHIGKGDKRMGKGDMSYKQMFMGPGRK